MARLRMARLRMAALRMARLRMARLRMAGLRMAGLRAERPHHKPLHRPQRLQGWQRRPLARRGMRLTWRLLRTLCVCR